MPLRYRRDNKTLGRAAALRAKAGANILRQLDLPGVPVAMATCAWCGGQFRKPTGGFGGRPIKFCSDECRAASAAAQTRAYLAAKPGDVRTGRTCVICGAAFDAPAQRGRVPQACSAACRAEQRRRWQHEGADRRRGRWG